jgi:hypothetical protein
VGHDVIVARLKEMEMNIIDNAVVDIVDMIFVLRWRIYGYNYVQNSYIRSWFSRLSVEKSQTGYWLLANLPPLIMNPQIINFPLQTGKISQNVLRVR